MAELLFPRTVVLSAKSQSQAKALGVSTFIIGRGDNQGHFGLFDVKEDLQILPRTMKEKHFQRENNKNSLL